MRDTDMADETEAEKKAREAREADDKKGRDKKAKDAEPEDDDAAEKEKKRRARNEAAGRDPDDDGDLEDDDEEAEDAATEFARSKMNATDRKAYDAMRAKDKKARDARPAKDAEPEPKPDDKKAMDAAIKMAKDGAMAEMQAIRQAERDVRPFIGDITTNVRSAAEVYKLALDELKIDVAGVPASAYGKFLAAQPKPGEGRRSSLAMDAAQSANGLSKIKGYDRLSGGKRRGA